MATKGTDTARLKVEDPVRHLPTGITGRVVSIQQRSRPIPSREGFEMESYVMATIRVTTAAYYGQYCDLPIAEIEMMSSLSN